MIDQIEFIHLFCLMAYNNGSLFFFFFLLSRIVQILGLDSMIIMMMMMTKHKHREFILIFFLTAEKMIIFGNNLTKKKNGGKTKNFIFFSLVDSFALFFLIFYSIDSCVCVCLWWKIDWFITQNVKEEKNFKYK